MGRRVGLGLERFGLAGRGGPWTPLAGTTVTIIELGGKGWKRRRFSRVDAFGRYMYLLYTFPKWPTLHPHSFHAFEVLYLVPSLSTFSNSFLRSAACLGKLLVNPSSYPVPSYPISIFSN